MQQHKRSNVATLRNRFPRDAINATYACAVCIAYVNSVCPFVRRLHWGVYCAVIAKRIYFFHDQVTPAPYLLFSHNRRRGDIPVESPLTGSLKSIWKLRFSSLSSSSSSSSLVTCLFFRCIVGCISNQYKILAWY